MRRISVGHSATAQLSPPLSNPDKVFWPDEGYTKRDLAEYYEAIFPELSPYVKDRMHDTQPIEALRDVFYRALTRQELDFCWPTVDESPSWVLGDFGRDAYMCRSTERAHQSKDHEGGAEVAMHLNLLAQGSPCVLEKIGRPGERRHMYIPSDRTRFGSPAPSFVHKSYAKARIATPVSIAQASVKVSVQFMLPTEIRFMKDMLAIVFSDKKAVHAGLRVIANMVREDSIQADSLDVVNKAAGGTVAREHMKEEFPIGTAAWMSLGGLAGLLGGPLGVAIGLGAGALLGLAADRYTFEELDRFLGDVSTALTSSKYAIVAAVEEDSREALDTHMQSIGGLVIRTVRSAGTDIGPRQVAALRAELNRLKAAHAKRFADRREDFQVQRAHLLAGRHEMIQAPSKPAGSDLRRRAALEGQMSHLSALERALKRDQMRAEQAELDLQERIDALQRQVNGEEPQARMSVDGHREL